MLFWVALKNQNVISGLNLSKNSEQKASKLIYLLSKNLLSFVLLVDLGQMFLDLKTNNRAALGIRNDISQKIIN